MFKTASGVHIPFPEKIEEGYSRYDNSFVCNISFEKLEPFFKEFCSSLPEPLILIIHIPLKSWDEERLHKEGNEGLHDQIYYLYRISREKFELFMQAYGALFLNDGLSKFGVGSMTSHDEIFITKYKIVQIFSKTLYNYIPLLNKYGFIQKEKLATVWDTFSAEHPGNCKSIKIKGKSVYEAVEKLKKMGLIAAKIVEDGSNI